MLKPPAGFRHAVPLEIRFSDLDALGHVNNARYLSYMEHARVRYSRDLGLWDVRATGLGVIMAKATIEYQQPLLLDDMPRVYTRISRLGTKSFDSEHVIVRERGDHDEIAALGFITLVAYDYRANDSISIPDDWREKILAYEGAVRGSKT